MANPIFDRIQDLSFLLSRTTPQKENPQKLASFLMRIHDLLNRLHDSSSFQSSASVLVPHLLAMRNTLHSYLSKSHLYQILHCMEFNDDLTLFSRSLAKWISAIAVSVQEEDNNEGLSQELSELSSELELTHFKASNTECEICAIIDEELRNGRHFNRDNDSLIARIARELGIISPDHVTHLSSQIQLYENDVQESARDTQISELLRNCLENSRYVVTEHPTTVSSSSGIDAVIIEEEQPCPPFQTFICPLSKGVMVEPVVLLETQQTYDRAGIEYWFQRCAEEGKPPTCPTTGKALNSTEWTRNVILHNTIAEWLDRNFESRISTAVRKLSSGAGYEEAVEDVRKISEESRKHRCTLRRQGVIPLLVKPWKRSEWMNGHELRSKVLIALRSMAIDNTDNKLEMVNEDVIRYAVKSLTSTEDWEKECAAQLLSELSSEPEICAKIGTQKGAVVLLDGLSCDGENGNVVRLAKHILANLEKEPSIVTAMADAGRLQPLLDLLNKGMPDVKLKMAGHLSQLTLSNNDKELVTICAGKVLIDMLAEGIAEKSVAIRTLLMLSDMEDNAVLLVEYGILQSLFSVINSKDYKSHISVLEDAVKVLANVIAKPGHWEEAILTENGNTMQSEYTIHCILGLMMRFGFKWKHSMLRLLYSIASSPKVSDAVVLHIQSGNGIQLLSLIIQESETENSKLALKILAILSKIKSDEVAQKLTEKNMYGHLMKSLKDSDPEEQGAAACIFAETLLTEKDLLEIFSVDVIAWIIEQLRFSSRDTSTAKQNALNNMKEGLLRLLLRFCMASDSRVCRILKEQNIMDVFKELLRYARYPPLMKMAADGLRILSERKNIPADMDPPASWNCCFAFLAQKKTPPKKSCRMHGDACQTPTTFCIVQADAVGPLIESLEDNDESVRFASICTLSTLLQDDNSLKAGLDELEKVNGIPNIIRLFCSVKPGELQDQLVFVIERITEVNEICLKYSVDQILTKTLVQAFKTAGSQATKKLAQIALTNLKQISGIVSIRK